MSRRMTDEEWKSFVLAAPARTAKLAVVRADGRPHVAPIWIDLDDDGTVVFNTGVDTLKGKAIRRDPRVSICFDDEQPPFSFVIIEGIAEIQPQDPDEKVVWATRIARRYMGDDQAETYGRRNGVPEELLVRVRPTKITAMAAISD